MIWLWIWGPPVRHGDESSIAATARIVTARASGGAVDKPAGGEIGGRVRRHSIWSSRSSRTEATRQPFDSWRRSKTWGRSQSCARRSAAAGRGLWRRSQADYGGFSSTQRPVREQIVKKVQLEQSIGFVHMYDGRFLEAAVLAREGTGTEQCGDGVPRRFGTGSRPCWGSSPCGAARSRTAWSARALRAVSSRSLARPVIRTHPARARRSSGSPRFSKESPRDLRIIWLLNIAYMTLGEHPEKVPPQYLIPTEVFRSKAEVAPFENVALRAGLGVRGPNLAGGSVFDDFDGDNRPDLFTTSLDAELGATLLDQPRRRHVRRPIRPPRGCSTRCMP